MGSEIVATDGDVVEDVGLNERQVAALQTLYDLGAGPREDGSPYSPDRRIRAQQLIYEGRLGGPRSPGARSKKKRASASVAEYVREKLAPKIEKALEDGLSPNQDITIRLRAADSAIKIEREEASLQLKEEESDLENASKEQLIATLIELAGDSSSEAALQGVLPDITLPQSAIRDITDEPQGAPDINVDTEGEGSPGASAPAVSDQAGPDASEAGSNGASNASVSDRERPNPFREAARRRAKQRRRAS